MNPERSTVLAREPIRAPRTVAVVLIVSALVGLVAAVALTVEKLQLLRSPDASLSCDLSALVACGKGLQSWQGSRLNFPNSIVGIAAWAALLLVGLIMLTRTSFAFTFWMGLNAGLLAGLALVIFLIYQSIYVLGTLCPWCMTTWVVMIPSTLVVLFFSLRKWSPSPSPVVRARAAVAAQWIPLTCLTCYLTIAILAQARLDLLAPH